MPASAKSSDVEIKLLLKIRGLGEVLIFLIYFARVEFLSPISSCSCGGDDGLREMALTRQDNAHGVALQEFHQGWYLCQA